MKKIYDESLYCQECGSEISIAQAKFNGYLCDECIFSTQETFHCAQCGIELTEEQLHRASDIVTVYCVPCGDMLIAQESINTYFYCAVHTTTSLTVTGNSYYCVDCGCTPQAMISADSPNPVTLIRWLDQAEMSYPQTQDDIPSEALTELPVMPDQATLENWQYDFNGWGKLASTGTGVSLETSRVTDELELIIQCLEKHIWYDGKPGAETRLLKLVNLFAGSMRKHMDTDQDWQACTRYQQDILFVRKAFLEKYCEYARRVLFSNARQERPRIPVLA